MYCKRANIPTHCKCQTISALLLSEMAIPLLSVFICKKGTSRQAILAQQVINITIFPTCLSMVSHTPCLCIPDAVFAVVLRLQSAIDDCSRYHANDVSGCR